MGLLNLGGPTAQFTRNRCSISPVELVLQSGVHRAHIPKKREHLLRMLNEVLSAEEFSLCNFLRQNARALSSCVAETFIRFMHFSNFKGV